MEIFAGELEAARATNVNLYIAQKIKAQSKKKTALPNQKRVGLLIITNFRLCFVVFDEHDKSDKSKVSMMSPPRDVLTSFPPARKSCHIRRTTSSVATTSRCPTWTRSTRTPTRSTNQ